VIQAQQVQQRRVKVLHGDPVLHGGEAQIVRAAEDRPSLATGTRQPGGRCARGRTRIDPRSESKTTLAAYEELAKHYAKHSMFSKKLSKTLEDIDKASKDLDKLLIKLYKKPNAVVFGD